MNSVTDILRNNVEQMGLVENLSLPHIEAVFGTAFLCAIIIYLVYKFYYKGAVYSENFGLLIIMSTMTVSFVIMTISSNIVLSLGMVGALSIVRFRTAVKDPLDVGFLFLAIGAGLTAGAGLYFAAIIGTSVICLIFVIMFFVGRSSTSYLVVVRCSVEAEADVMEELEGYRSKLKSKSSDGEMTELTFAAKVRKEDIVVELLEIEGVENALLVSYTGDAEY